MTAVLAVPVMGQPALRFEVRHDHWRKHGTGILVIDDRGVSYREVSKKSKKPDELHRGEWAFQDIQQLYISPKRLVLVTYEDRKWLLGSDKDWEFTIAGDATFDQAYQFLKDRIDQRLIAAFADSTPGMMWEIPAKLQGRLVGSEGVLQVAPSWIVFKTDKQERSRTWRYSDIDNISSSGPFQLTLTTYERARPALYP